VREKERDIYCARMEDGAKRLCSHYTINILFLRAEEFERVKKEIGRQRDSERKKR